MQKFVLHKNIHKYLDKNFEKLYFKFCIALHCSLLVLYPKLTKLNLLLRKPNPLKRDCIHGINLRLTS